MLVVQASRNKICTLERTVKNLDYLGVKLIGSVINKVRYDLPTAVDKLL